MQTRTRTRWRGPTIAAWAVTAAALLATPTGTSSARPADDAKGVLFREGFDDDRLPGRGWYDGRAVVIDRRGARAGDGCIAYRWKEGGTTPEGSSALRRQFDPTDTIYFYCNRFNGGTTAQLVSHCGRRGGNVPVALCQR